jgi:hypothetical protein
MVMTFEQARELVMKDKARKAKSRDRRKTRLNEARAILAKASSKKAA